MCQKYMEVIEDNRHKGRGIVSSTVGYRDALKSLACDF